MSELPLALTLPMSGTRLIEASAGTGKTYTLVLLLLRAIVTGGCEPRDLVAVTFTRAAAGELRERVRIALSAAARRAADPNAAIAEHLSAAIDALIDQALGEGDGDRSHLARRLRAAELRVDELWLSTLHGFCQRLLGEFGPQLGEPGGLDQADAGDDLLAQVCADAWRALQSGGTDAAAILAADQFESPDELLDRLRPILELAPETLLPSAEPDALASAMQRQGEAWTTARKALVGYDDLAALIADDKSTISRAQGKGLSDDRLIKLKLDLCAFFEAAPGTRPFTGCLCDLSTSGLARLQTPAARKAGKALPSHALADALQALLEADEVWRMQVQVALMHRLHRQVRERLAQAALEQGRQRFDDLVGRLVAVLAGPNGDRLRELARSRWRLALIDEFQDTDGDQYTLFEGLFAGRMILVGDPKQAIYAFRGGDVHAYRRAAGQAEGEHRLAACRRSEPAVVEAINTLFDPVHVPDAFPEPFIQYHPVDCAYDATRHGRLYDRAGAEAAGLRLWPFDGEKNGVWSSKGRAQDALRSAIGQAVVDLLDPGHGPRLQLKEGETIPLRPGDIAVLCRTTPQCQAIAAELRRRGVPVSLAADQSIEAAAAEDLRRLLAAWLAPGDVGRLRALALSGLYGLQLDQLDGSSEHSPLDSAQLSAHAEQVRLAQAGELGRALLLAVRAGAAAAKRRPDSEARVDAWLRLVDRLAAWAGPGIGLNDLYLRYRRWQLGLAREDEVVPPAPALDAVQVLTMHGSKGLEFGVVFVPFLWDQRGADSVGEPGARAPVRFHDSEHRLRADLGGPQFEAHHAIARDEQLAEAMRLAYVALTRARHRLYVPVLVASSWPDAALARLLPELRMANASDLAAVVQRLAARAPNAIRVETPPLDDGRLHREPAAGAAVEMPLAQRLLRPPPDEFRLLSYSRIARGLVDLPQDHEQGTAVDASADLIEVMPVDRLPRGAAFGSAFHALMERLDPVAGDPEHLARIAADHGYGGERERTYLERLWRDTVAAALPGATSIAALPAQDRAIELEFFLPLRDFAARDLGQALALDCRYQRPAERWPATLVAARGYLRGFIDLVYQAEGRYYVLDYKTNDLGPDAAAYGPDGLAAAIADHDYDLQYLIYLVALQRLLRSRLGSDYDYERQIGGAVYLFVRGLAGGAGRYVDRPARAVIDALEAVFCGAVA